MPQNWEQCEVYELDSENALAGTRLIFFTNEPKRKSHFLTQHFAAVVTTLKKADWEVEHSEPDPAGNMAILLRRHIKAGRSIDDALGALH